MSVACVKDGTQGFGGMTIFFPSTTVSLVMLFACLMAAEGTLYFALMPESVSPATTVWMMAAPLLEGLVTGAGRFGDVTVLGGLTGVGEDALSS